jgi:S1-C subfamily serine protease
MLYPTVRITTPSGTGSGVIIESSIVEKFNSSKATIKPLNSSAFELYVLTAAHVVDKENTVNIELYNSTIITGTVVITDTVKDLAFIKPQINTRPNQPDRLPAPMSIGAGDRKVGQADFTDKIYTARLSPKDYVAYLFSPVWAVGCSLGLKPRPSYGHITAINEQLAINNAQFSLLTAQCPFWEISSPVLPGNSGGPVYDARTYEVIGIAVWVKVYQYQLVTTMAGIVPINQIYEFLGEVTSRQKTVDSE